METLGKIRENIESNPDIFEKIQKTVDKILESGKTINKSEKIYLNKSLVVHLIKPIVYDIDRLANFLLNNPGIFWSWRFILSREDIKFIFSYLTKKLVEKTDIDKVFELFKNIRDHLEKFPKPYEITNDKKYRKELIDKYSDIFGKNYCQDLVTLNFHNIQELLKIRDMFNDYPEIYVSYEKYSRVYNAEKLMDYGFWNKDIFERHLRCLIDEYNVSSKIKDFHKYLDSENLLNYFTETRNLLAKRQEWGVKFDFANDEENELLYLMGNDFSKTNILEKCALMPKIVKGFNSKI